MGSIRSGVENQTRVTRNGLPTGECHTLAARERIRQQIQDDVARFLDSGGEVHEFPPTARAENADTEH